MKILRREILFAFGLAFCLLIGSIGLGVHPAAAQEAGPVAQAAPPTRLESTAYQLFQAYQSGGLSAAQAFAAQRGLRLAGDQLQVTVITSGLAGQVETVTAWILAAGGSLQSGWGAQVQALVPLQKLPELAALPEVSWVRPPLRGVPEVVTTQGDAAINADTFRSSVGADGSGVKVAILDAGFEGYTTRQAEGELPLSLTAISFRADGVLNGVSEHGAACAEIVYDIVPGATFYLVNYETDTEFYNAVDYLVGQGVRVISHSISWFNAGPYDGSSGISQRIDQARAQGVLWVNSAGNRAQQHWEGSYVAGDGNYHVWSGTDTYNRVTALSGTITAYLSWNDWPASSNDYDLELYKQGSGGVWSKVASSNNPQTGSQEPSEAIEYKVSGLGTYAVRVIKVSGSARYLELFTTQQNLGYQVADSSIPNAADAAGAMSAGAVDVTLYNTGTIESYSSRGPTNAAGGGAPNYANGSRIKPDVAAPDAVSTVTYGANAFTGTSSSAPHTAGAAALYASGYLGDFSSLPSPAQIQTYLENCAESSKDWGSDINGTIKNNSFGAGGLYLCQSPTAVRTTGVRAAAQQRLAWPALLLLAVAGSLALAQVRRRSM